MERAAASSSAPPATRDHRRLPPRARDAVRGVETPRPALDGTDKVPRNSTGSSASVADYVRVEDLAVVSSEGRGIQFEDADHATVAVLCDELLQERH